MAVKEKKLRGKRTQGDKIDFGVKSAKRGKNIPCKRKTTFAKEHTGVQYPTWGGNGVNGKYVATKYVNPKPTFLKLCIYMMPRSLIAINLC